MNKNKLMSYVLEENENLLKLVEKGFAEGFNEGFNSAIETLEVLLVRNGKSDDNGVKWFPITKQYLDILRNNLKNKGENESNGK